MVVIGGRPCEHSPPFPKKIGIVDELGLVESLQSYVDKTDWLIPNGHLEINGEDWEIYRLP